MSYVSQVRAVIIAVLSKISSGRGETTFSGRQLFLSSIQKQQQQLVSRPEALQRHSRQRTSSSPLFVEDGAGEAAEMQSPQSSANLDLAQTNTDPVSHFPSDAQTGSESHSKPSIIASLCETLRLTF